MFWFFTGGHWTDGFQLGTVTTNYIHCPRQKKCFICRQKLVTSKEIKNIRPGMKNTQHYLNRTETTEDCYVR